MSRAACTVERWRTYERQGVGGDGRSIGHEVQENGERQQHFDTSGGAADGNGKKREHENEVACLLVTRAGAP